MERVELDADVQFSRIVYGLWRLADDVDTTPAHVQAKIETCLEQGITTMDHADIYGGYTGEVIFGRALAVSPALRDAIEIVTKCGIVAPVGRHSDARVKHYNTSAAHITASVETSLRQMKTDNVDLLLIHRPDPLIDPEETGKVLDDLVASGKVRSVGVSNFRPWDFTLLQSAMTTTLVTNQIEMSLQQADAFTNGDLAFLQERRLPPMAWSPLGGGRLFADRESPLFVALSRIAREQEVDVSAVAISWLLHHPSRILPVIGTNSLGRISNIGAAARVKIDRQTWFELYTLAIGHKVP